MQYCMHAPLWLNAVLLQLRGSCVGSPGQEPDPLGICCCQAPGCYLHRFVMRVSHTLPAGTCGC